MKTYTDVKLATKSIKTWPLECLIEAFFSLDGCLLSSIINHFFQEVPIQFLQTPLHTDL